MHRDHSASFRSRAWLTSPIRTALGELQLAGGLRDVPGISPNSMRILGSYALVYFVSGQGYYRDARGIKADLVPGDLILIQPDVAHAYGPTGGTRWDQIYFVFNGPEFEHWARTGFFDPARPLLHLEPVDYWRRRLEEVVSGETWHDEASAMRVFGRFLHLCTDMMAVHLDRRQDREVKLQNAQRLLGTPGEKGWLTPQEAARQVGLSYDNFRKQFSAQVGTSPAQYQKRQRIEHACAAIYAGGREFKELAEVLEFCDVFHFSKAFKDVVGLTPSEFRKKVRGQ